VFALVELESLEINASSNSFGAVVENCAVEDWVAAED
jgi:hypothetical protein